MIRKTTINELNELIQRWDENADNTPFRAYAFDGMSRKWVAVDNSNGCCWTKEFDTVEEARNYLEDDAISTAIADMIIDDVTYMGADLYEVAEAKKMLAQELARITDEAPTLIAALTEKLEQTRYEVSDY